MSLLSYPLLYTWASRRGKYVSMHFKLCFMCGHQSGESKLLRCPSMDQHHGFQPWTVEAAAFHSNWTIKQLIELISTLISTTEEELISEIICCSGVDHCTSMYGGWQQHLTSANLREDCLPIEDGLDLRDSNMAQTDQIQAIWGYLHPTTALTLTRKVRWTTK